MTIKSLLLGSAAALVAVSGAHAADAIVAPEPEAVEYVKVCDTYGAGYYYIPGTETCLSINGFIRADFKTTNDFDRTRNNGVLDSVRGVKRHSERFDYRARLNFDARTETELGTLRSFLRFQADSSGNKARDINVVVDHALIQLGGFTVGYGDSNWVNQDYGLNGVMMDGYYGYAQRNMIGYEFAQDGLSAGVFAEFDFNNAYNAKAGQQTANTWSEPDVVGRVKYEGGWGSIWALAGYDNRVDEAAAKLGAQINLDAITEGAAFKIQGTYDFGGNKNNANGKSTRFTDGNEWDFLVGYSQPIGDTLAMAVGYQTSDEWDAGEALANLTWTPVTGFSVAGEVRYRLEDHVSGEGVDGLVRFKRSF